MIGQPETQENSEAGYKTKDAILNGFYAALGGAIFAAAYAFVRAQFDESGSSGE